MKIILRIFSILILVYTLSLNLKASESDSLKTELIYDLIDSTWNLYSRYEFDSMVMIWEDNFSLVEHDDSLTLDVYYALGIAHSRLYQDDKQFEVIVKGLLLAQKTDNRWMLLSLYRELGRWHDYAIDDQEEGLKYFKKAIPYLDAVAADSKCGLMMDIGLTSLNYNQVDSAGHYYEKALEYMKEDTNMRADVYSFYAPYLIETKQYDRAEEYLKYSMKSWEDQNYEIGISSDALSYAQLYFAKGRYEEASINAQKCLSICLKDGNFINASEAAELLGKSQEALGDIQGSLDSYKLNKELKDSVTVIKKEQLLEQKRLSLVKLEFQEELNQINQHNRKLNKVVSHSRTALFLLGFGVILLSLFLYRLRVNKKKEITILNDQLNQYQKETERIKADYERAMEEINKNKRELTSSALFLERKNETIKSVRELLSNINLNDEESISTTLKSAHKLADKSLRAENNWESFLYFFKQVYPSFHKKIKKEYPVLNKNELRYLSYIKMGLTDKESARLLGINVASFQKSKYRLKKKLDLPKEETIGDLIEKY